MNAPQDMLLARQSFYSINPWLERAQAPLLRRLLSASQSGPGTILLSLGLPAEELLPSALVASVARQVLEQDPFSLQLGPPYAPLRTEVVALMAERGVRCREDQVLLTSGAQQALDLVARLLLRKDSVVLLEENTFPGIRQAIEPFEAKIVTIRSNPQTGIDLGDLQRKLETVQPAFLYSIPDGHNPLGVTIPADNRREMVRIAQNHGLLILEDDTYGFLCLEGDLSQPLRALDEDLTIYIGSFSKTFAPGLRLGWMVAPQHLTQKLALLRDLTEIDSCTLSQRILTRALQTGEWKHHIGMLRSVYREKRDAMCDSLSVHFGEFAKWEVPSAGFFVWVRFQEKVDSLKLFEATLRDEHTAFAPGTAFMGRDDDGCCSCARLSYSYASKRDIKSGVEGMARAFRRLS